jgi:hypothetical protein
MDYGKVGVGAATATTLAFTGADTLWAVIAAVALIGVGAAAMRLLPKKDVTP